MAYAVDTNIFIYAHMGDFPESKKVRPFLEEKLQSPDTFFMAWQVYYEYIRLVTHPAVLTKPLSVQQAIQDLKPYLKDPRCHLLQETDLHETIFSELMKKLPHAKGNFIHDCHYATLLKEHAVREIVTCDMDFKKFDFLEVINPLTL